jgi:multicomponent Na+:H+ antiporter subunit B
MNTYSMILRTTVQFMLPLLLMFSVFLLLRGHDLPGGGFIAGLVAAAAFVSYLFAHDVTAVRRVLRADPRALVAVGLLLATLSGFVALAFGDAFFTGQWYVVDVPQFGTLKFSTPLLFDIGVYLVVLGSVMQVVMALAEVED